MGFFRAARWLCQKGFGLGEPCNSSKKLPFIGHSLAKALTSMISFGPTKTLCGRYYYHCHFTDGKTEVQRAHTLKLAHDYSFQMAEVEFGSRQPGCRTAFLWIKLFICLFVCLFVLTKSLIALLYFLRKKIEFFCPSFPGSNCFYSF